MPSTVPGLGVPDRVERADDPEVGHLRAALVVQEHVLRLDVAVDEPLSVRECERAADLEAELEHPPDRQRAAALDELLQVLAVDELEDDELLPVLLAAVDHRDDVRMRELRDCARLAPEAVDVLLVLAVVLVQDLQRDVPLEQRVEGAVDGRHAARARPSPRARTGPRSAAPRPRNVAFPLPEKPTPSTCASASSQTRAPRRARRP